MPGKVTIATNMAGRGTDIKLGGNNEAELEQAAAAAGEAGLDEVTAARIRADWQARHDKVVAAGRPAHHRHERHESRRIDNQLRGRSGRQGDPGSSRFYLSMEDNLMRIFGDPNRTKKWLAMAGMKEGEVIESGMLTRQIEKAQRKVEGHNFDIRKQLLTFDDVANDQRKVIYQQRTELMGATNLAGSPSAAFARKSCPASSTNICRPTSATRNGISPGLANSICQELLDAGRSGAVVEGSSPRSRVELRGRVIGAIDAMYDAKVLRIGEPIMRHVEKDIMLKVLDQQWREHLGRHGLSTPGHPSARLRAEGLSLRVQARAFELFAAMLERIKFDTGHHPRDARRAGEEPRADRSARKSSAVRA
jgi:preprotein translocase subunit SecA